MNIPHATICKGCWQQMRLPVPLRGPMSAPFRIIGIRPSRMNPNTCTICETMFKQIMRARMISVDVTVMFADLRDYTSLSESHSPGEMSELLDTFYDECANAIWLHDGILNKTIGDAVMAVFNFPIRDNDHAAKAVAAARQIQSRFTAMTVRPAEDSGQIGIGIGIDSGKVSFGEFGHAHRDLTAIGTVVNIASRAQSEAASGQILVTGSVRQRAADVIEACMSDEYVLKGIRDPVTLYTV